jgi:hypothetical protein
LKKITQKSRVPLPAIQTGQVWRMEKSNLHIGLMGKTLVHYKHFKGSIPRAPVSLAVKDVLVKYLVEHEAVLMQP